MLNPGYSADTSWWGVGAASLLLLGVFFVLAPQLTMAQPTSGYDWEVDATKDTDGDNRWEDTVGTAGFELLLDNSPAVTRTSQAAGAFFSHAYNFIGGSINNEAGALLVQTGTTTASSFQNYPGDWSNNKVTMEIWLKPDNLAPTPNNGQIVFEDGGGTGLGFFIDDNKIEVRKQPGNKEVTYNLSTDPSSILKGAATAKFFQAVGTYDVSTGKLQLYVNGTFIGEQTPGGNDWSGGDSAAFGTRGAANVGGIGGGQQSTESFDGQIALVRVYDN